MNENPQNENEVTEGKNEEVQAKRVPPPTGFGVLGGMNKKSENVVEDEESGEVVGERVGESGAEYAEDVETVGDEAGEGEEEADEFVSEQDEVVESAEDEEVVDDGGVEEEESADDTKAEEIREWEEEGGAIDEVVVVEGEQTEEGGEEASDDGFGFEAPILTAVTFRRPLVEAVRLNPGFVYGNSEKVEKKVEVEFRKPLVEAVRLNPGLVYGKAEEVEEPLAVVEFRKPLVEPVRLDPALVYGKVEEAVEQVDQADQADQADQTDDQEEGRFEVMGAEKKAETSALVGRSAEVGQVSKWAFWKRRSKRDEQLERVTEGYLEMVDLIRAIRNQMESQNQNNLILRDSLSHLPAAIQGLEEFGRSQNTIGDALREVHRQMSETGVNDEKLAKSMEGFNETLRGMDGTSRLTMQTFDRVQERMRDSDIRMESLFRDVQGTEEKVSETMARLQRNMAIMQTIFLICLMVAIGALVVLVLKRETESKAPQPTPIILQAPAASEGE